ncbi:UDP-N-acetylglucosamine 2-epimerase (non-hydrolyzing) [Fulvivirga ligni]|nr:UDP-N-acetylglucosamine 2-epimerase (non-hydrolyzing) [Fulvivirga ligni]
MAPLIKAFKSDSYFDVRVLVTGQHREMLDQVLEFFDISPDYDLNLMSANQTLFDITAKSLQGIQPVLKEFQPDNIFVQGDTSTAFVGSLAGFYEKISVSHIEAGLRSGDMTSPYPEEGNRKLAGVLATYHFAPTERAVSNLTKEGYNSNIFMVGNTVIDALLLGLKLIEEKGEEPYKEYFQGIDLNKKIILVTGHRRESFGEPFENMCRAIKEIAQENDVQVVYPVHLNPNVRSTVGEILNGIDNVHLIEPLSYPYLIWLMNKSYFVLTDSGGIQEEAPSLGKPVLVMRDVTERQEGIDAGTALLVGTERSKIVAEANKLLKNKDHYKKMANAVNPYGDGTTSQQIVKVFRG